MLTFPIETRIFFKNDGNTPLGRITMAGTLRHERGIARRPLRVLGSYAVVYILEGGGDYRDTNGYRQRVGAGDLIFIFPELAHRYGPRPDEYWAEIYAVFDGPLFELWRAQNLLDAQRPIRHIEPLEQWGNALESVLTDPRPATAAERTVALVRFAEVLTALVTADVETPEQRGEELWVARARTLLEANLERPVTLADIADEVGVPEQTFRKRFQQRVGMSPIRYRTARRMEAARAMLQQGHLSNKEIAASLGFTDAFHFSKQFRQHTGLSPRVFVQRQRDEQA